MSDDSCIQCQNVVRPRQEALQCDGCQKWQHRTCNSDPSIVVDRSFDIPKQVQEDSIADEYIGDIPEDDPTVHCKPLKRAAESKRKLCDSGDFNYTVKKQKNDHILWRCTKRNKTINCPATVIQDGDNFKPGMKEHVHPAEPGSVIAVMIKKEIKAKARDAVFGQSSKTIVTSVLRQHADIDAPEPSRPNPSSLQRTCNRVTASLTPDDPKDLDFELDLDYLDQKAPDFYQKDVVVGNNRHLIFYTDRQLQLLAKAKTWYMDGTFRIVNAPWMQMFSIHAFVRSGDSMKQVPLVFCFMSGKSQEDYYQVLRAIDRRLPEHLKLQGMVVDFEAGLWQALRQRFPGTPIQGCAFHWAQAVFRKIQENGLQSAYNKKDAVYTYLRQVMALPFLPPEHIPDTFRQLDEKADHPGVQKVMDYIYKTWIRNSVFDIDYWCVFMSSIRTNNDVEGWHNSVNTRVCTRGPVPFYSLVTELFKEASDIPLQLKLVSEGKLQRYQRKQSRQTQGRLFALWDEYCNNSISASRLLKECASVYGPPPK
ncbi:unnamed protein product [Mytilus edulis]|uniref:MULE transposase domain-containing protein n=1 Tax=Mytilus edulis TaxID=6550 RepID=A0A8S3RZ99_MYTED|nr:unnamed protein product [Mytilus edulis]